MDLASRLWFDATRCKALLEALQHYRYACSPEVVLSLCHGERLSRDEHVYLTEHLDEATWMVRLWQQSLESVH